MKKRSLRNNNSGQVLIVSSLLVALLLLSTALYVIETEKNVPVTEISDSGFCAYQQSIRNTMISSLANITNGGETGILTSNLNELTSIITSHSYKDVLSIEATPLNTVPYQNGVWTFWGTDGEGISSAYCDFVFASSGNKETFNMKYAVNVTSEIKANGSYQLLGDNSSQVNLSVNVLNEGAAALAQNFTFYFDFDGSYLTSDWISVGSPSITSLGNGTYTVSFTCQTSQPNDPVLVLVDCQDQRGILVETSLTCVKVGE